VLLNTRIDRSSYIPLYAQVRDAVRESIERGAAQPDDQLPSEPELCRLFDVSRTVVRQALVGLEYEGLVVRRKGRGTFVAQPKIGESLFQELTGFYQDMARRGQTPTSKVLTQQVIPSSAKVADALHLTPGAPVIHIDRVRLIADEPLVYVSTFLPQTLFPSLVTTDLTNRSLYAFLEEQYGTVIARGRRKITAVVAGEYEAKLLEVSPGAPLIVLDSISYLDNGTPIEYYHALHRGDRSVFEVELVRSEPARHADGRMGHMSGLERA
jgi:GntR family transcriptional regulator